MADSAVEPTVLDKLREQRSKERDELAKVIEARIKVRDAFDEATADDEARTAFLAAEDQHVADVERRERSIRSLSRRVKEERVLAERRASAAKAASRVAPVRELRTTEPLTYRADNSLTGQYGHGHSYFADLAAIHNKLPNADVFAARERIDRHAQEMRVEIPRIEEKRARESRKKIEASMEARIRARGYEDPFQRSTADSPFGVETRTTPGRTDGQGGYVTVPTVAA